MSEAVKPKIGPVLENLEESIKLWWKHLGKFVLIFIWSIVYSLIPMALAGLLFGLNYWYPDLDFALRVLNIILGIVASLVAFYFSLRGQIGAYLLIKRNYEGNELAIYRETKDLFWPYLGLSLLTTLFVLLWSLLLIIPGIIYGIFYTFAPFALFWEGKKIRAAIRRSTDLVTGYWWPVFGRLLLASLVLWVVMIVVSFPMFYMEENSLNSIMYNILVQIVSFLVAPALLIFSYNIYKDLIKIKA